MDKLYGSHHGMLHNLLGSIREHMGNRINVPWVLYTFRASTQAEIQILLSQIMEE